MLVARVKATQLNHKRAEESLSIEKLRSPSRTCRGAIVENYKLILDTGVPSATTDL